MKARTFKVYKAMYKIGKALDKASVTIFNTVTAFFLICVGIGIFSMVEYAIDAITAGLFIGGMFGTVLGIIAVKQALDDRAYKEQMRTSGQD